MKFTKSHAAITGCIVYQENREDFAWVLMLEMHHVKCECSVWRASVRRRVLGSQWGSCVCLCGSITAQLSAEKLAFGISFPVTLFVVSIAPWSCLVFRSIKCSALASVLLFPSVRTKTDSIDVERWRRGRGRLSKMGLVQWWKNWWHIFILILVKTSLFWVSPLTPALLDSDASEAAAKRMDTFWLSESLPFPTKIVASSDSGCFRQETVALYPLRATSNRD